MIRNDVSRLSRLGDHNMFRNSDNLYEPLRNALRKSSVSHTNLMTGFGMQGDLTQSRVARNMKSLSPM